MTRNFIDVVVEEVAVTPADISRTRVIIVAGMIGRPLLQTKTWMLNRTFSHDVYIQEYECGIADKLEALEHLTIV